MTRRSAVDVGFLLVDGFNLLSTTAELTDQVSAVIEETLSLGDSWPGNTYIGVNKAELEQQGYFDTATNSSHAALAAGTGTSRNLCYALAGNVIGQPFVGYAGAMQINYEVLASKEQLHRANAKYSGSGQVDEGLIVRGHSAVTGSGNSRATPVTVPALTTLGGIAYLQISALTLGGATGLTITVEHSADLAVWSTLTTFTVITVAPGAQRIVVAGTVNRHLAVAWSFAGGVAPAATFFVGFRRN